MVKGL